MPTLLRYRTVIYAGTVLTGLTGLVYQVVWQKYLSFIVGSETRSVSLVVAVFLGGLAAGYRYWGRLSERVADRRKLLRIYGLIELGIGLYAALFPLYLRLVTALGHSGPAWLLTDLLMAALTLLVPTFLMGATIPLLVRVVPEAPDEIHVCHAKIYGINTLGACLGAFGSSFFLIPKFGLLQTLLLASGVNLIVGTVFMLNRLGDRVARDEPIEPIPHHFPLPAIYAYTLVTGTVTLSLEVLFVRVLGLTIGNGPHNFAIVVGVFVLGLATGSLLLSGRMLSVRVLFGAITLLVFYLIALFHSVPYWPYWLNNVRAAMRSLPVNYTVYLLLVTGFLMLVLLPFLVPLGTMLPLVYGLLPKDTTDYGKKVGWLYFYNTLGTAAGAIVLSYLLLYALELDQIFKLDVLLLAGLAVYLMLKERRLRLAGTIGIVTLLFLIGPGWNRSSHYVGLFRSPDVESFNFQGWFETPNLAPGVVFFEDGPDSTATVVEYPHGNRVVADAAGRAVQVPLTSRSMVINGKADGDTLSDYSTITLAALLPYLHAPDRTDLRATVVGLGTGLTAGLLARGEDVEAVTVVEISSTLVDALHHFDQANFGLSSNPKARVLGMDGFKYFSRLDERQDIVVSASSPPWVVGVENLFTPRFYQLAHDALADDGVFLQWFPMYAMNDVAFRTILANVGSVFPHRRLYRISFAEMGILASKAPLPAEPLGRRFDEPTVTEVRANMQLVDPSMLSLIELFETAELDAIVREGDSRTHTLVRPGLSYISDRVRFLDPDIDWDRFVDPRLVRLAAYDERRAAGFRALVESRPQGLQCALPTLGPRLFCARFNPLAQAWAAYSSPPGALPLAAQIQAYDLLRQEGVVAPDATFGSQAVTYLIDRFPADPQGMQSAFEALLGVYEKDGMWDAASAATARLVERGIAGPDYRSRVTSRLEGSRRAREAFVERFRGS